MGKKSLVIGAAVGYVLGARAGRKRYDQIAAAVSRLWNDPKVKSKVDQAQTTAVDSAKSAAASAKDAVTSNPKVQGAVRTAKDKLPGSSSSPAGPSSPAGSSSPAGPAPTNSGQPGSTTAATPRTGTGTGTTTLPSTPPLNTPGSASTTPRP